MKTLKEVMEERLERAFAGHPWHMEIPDISCKKCGREIYCGVNSLCSDPECEKKKPVPTNHEESKMTPKDLVIGGKYNWIHQPERLIYVGVNRGWYQFQKIGDPRPVWCEVLASDLDRFEESK